MDTTIIIDTLANFNGDILTVIPDKTIIIGLAWATAVILGFTSAMRR
jgi:hypothetical protein